VFCLGTGTSLLDGVSTFVTAINICYKNFVNFVNVILGLSLTKVFRRWSLSSEKVNKINS
jgi:hypothetical protein